MAFLNMEVIAGIFNRALTSKFQTTFAASTSNSEQNCFTFQNAVEFIVIVILFFVSGMLGGAFGVFLKNGIKKTMKESKKIICLLELKLKFMLWD